MIIFLEVLSPFHGISDYYVNLNHFETSAFTSYIVTLTIFISLISNYEKMIVVTLSNSPITPSIQPVKFSVSINLGILPK